MFVLACRHGRIDERTGDLLFRIRRATGDTAQRVANLAGFTQPRLIARPAMPRIHEAVAESPRPAVAFGVVRSAAGRPRACSIARRGRCARRRASGRDAMPSAMACRQRPVERTAESRDQRTCCAAPALLQVRLDQPFHGHVATVTVQRVMARPCHPRTQRRLPRARGRLPVSSRHRGPEQQVLRHREPTRAIASAALGDARRSRLVGFEQRHGGAGGKGAIAKRVVEAAERALPCRVARAWWSAAAPRGRSRIGSASRSGCAWASPQTRSSKERRGVRPSAWASPRRTARRPRRPARARSASAPVPARHGARGGRPPRASRRSAAVVARRQQAHRLSPVAERAIGIDEAARSNARRASSAASEHQDAAPRSTSALASGAHDARIGTRLDVGRGGV